MKSSDTLHTESESRRITKHASRNALGGETCEGVDKCSLQRSLRCTCFTFICCLMHLSACLIEFIGSYILFGACTRSEIVTSVFVDSLPISLSLIICVRLCGRTATAQTVSGIGLVFKLEEVIAGIGHRAEVKTVTQIFHLGFKVSL